MVEKGEVGCWLVGFEVCFGCYGVSLGLVVIMVDGDVIVDFWFGFIWLCIFSLIGRVIDF